MKQKHISYGFLLEMIWVCAFFLICSSIFVLSFARAEKLSRDADTLNQAVLAASNAMEETFAGLDNTEERNSTDTFTLKISTTEAEQLLSASIQVLDRKDGSVLYTLEGTHFVSATQENEKPGGM